MTEQPNLPAVREPGGLDVHYEHELDVQADPGPPVPADLAPAARPERLPVIPGHLASRAAVRATVSRLAGRYTHLAKYHGVRSPVYLLSACWWALVGMVRLAVKLAAWAHVSEQHVLRSQAVAAKDSKTWMNLQQQAGEMRRVRWTVLGAGAFAAGIAGVVAVKYAPWWLLALASGVLLMVLARAGRPADRQIISSATVEQRYRKLNPDVVIRAYEVAGLANQAKEGQRMTFAAKMARDGEGARCVIDLPYGRTLKDAMDAREKLASGLDVTASQVYISRDPTSERRHVLWVADRDPLAAPVGRTPLLACRATDIWKPAPLGLDERGQLVSLPLMWQSVLIGSLPRQGKTFTTRLLGLYAALDPYVKLHVFDPSGKPDWRKFALVAESCSFGLTPTREGLPAEILLATLEFIKKDVQDRYNRLSEMPTSVCPEGKLTREIARDPRWNMPVRVLLLDEFQEYFDLGSISKEIATLIVFLTKVAPAAGVIVIDATQKPSGIGSGEVSRSFTSARDNHQVRFSLRTSSYSVSEAVLGQGAYGEGLDSSTLLPEYKGVGILRGATDRSPTVRTYFADHPDAEKILTAARALRERAGTLSGMAAGTEAQTPARDVLADVLAVFGADPGLHWEVLAARLRTRFPERWEDATSDAVSAQCRDLGVPSVTVKMLGRTLRGCRRNDIEQAAGR